MSSTFDYESSDAQFTFDVNTNPLFRKDTENYINKLSVDQLNTLNDLSMLDIFLGKDSIIEPHYHPNASELTYCISGSAIISIMNPFTKVFHHYAITPGQVVNIPQGWWHYQIAYSPNTHLQGIFNTGNPEVILGSDILTATPADVFAYSYGLDVNEWKAVTDNIKPSTLIGPSESHF